MEFKSHFQYPLNIFISWSRKINRTKILESLKKQEDLRLFWLSAHGWYQKSAAGEVKLCDLWSLQPDHHQVSHQKFQRTNHHYPHHHHVGPQYAWSADYHQPACVTSVSGVSLSASTDHTSTILFRLCQSRSTAQQPEILKCIGTRAHGL